MTSTILRKFTTRSLPAPSVVPVNSQSLLFFLPKKMNRKQSVCSLFSSTHWIVVVALADKKPLVVAVIHLGRALCGHDGIIHGGLLATVLDETLGRNALLNLPSRIGVTANLNINYRSPCMADQFVVVKTKLVELKGRKCTVEAKMETLNGELVADAKWVTCYESKHYPG